MNFKIKNRPIGDGFPCYISFEAGPTHDGMDSAIELVDQAADAGADAIKFQIIDADRLISNRDQQFSYTILRDKNTGETQEIKESLYKILKRRELQIGEWRKIKQHADLKGLAFFATIAFEDQIEEMQRLKIDSIKIASSDVNHHSLIRGAASTGMCIQLDTGSSSLGEIETAVDTVLSTGNDRIVIHQCPSGYPARLDGINLNMIKTLKTMFGVPVAYSDHTPGWIMDVAAVSIGANMVEKTITLDRATPSVEHIFSLEGKELVEFVNAIREVESAMGALVGCFSQKKF